MATPLYKKLGLKSGMTCYFLNEPDNYLKLISPVEKDIIQKKRLTGKIDFIHLFAKDGRTLERHYLKLKDHLAIDGTFWISWLKQSSKIPTDLNRELLRSYGLANGLVDVKVCSVNDSWSALKFVYRLKDRN